MRRREFITLLGGATAWPLVARAQQPGRSYRLAFVTPGPRNVASVIALCDELRLHGFVEGQNISVHAHGFDLRNEELAKAAAAIVESAPDVIVSTGPEATRATQAATKTIPIVATSDNMVEEGLISSLARPGGNTTGVTLLAAELDGKRQDILVEAAPKARRIAALADPAVATPEHLQALNDGARARAVELSIFFADTREKIVPAINEAKASGAAALNVLATPLFFFNRSIQRLARARPNTRKEIRMSDDLHVLAVAAVHRGVELYAGRSAERLAEAKRQIDEVAGMTSASRLFAFAVDAANAPEARLVAKRRILAGLERRQRMPVDVTQLKAATIGLEREATIMGRLIGMRQASGWPAAWRPMGDGR